MRIENYLKVQEPVGSRVFLRGVRHTVGGSKCYPWQSVEIEWSATWLSLAILL